MKNYTVPVRYTGKIEYQIDANSEQEALNVAEEMAANEENLDEMEDIDYEVLPAVAVSKSKSDGQDADAAGDKNTDKAWLSKLLRLLSNSVPQIVNFTAVTKSGEKVAALRSSKSPKDESNCIREMLSCLNGPLYFPGTVSGASGLSYRSFPLLEDDESFRYLIVCYGREDALDQAFSVFDFVSNLYKLNK